MNEKNLFQIFASAQLGANIALKFYPTVGPIALLYVETAVARMQHSQKNGYIMIVHLDQEKHEIIIAKTLSATDADMEQLAHATAKLVDTAEARSIPDFSITLAHARFWKLMFSGGNKLLRAFFKATIDSGNLLLNIEAEFIEDKKGIAVIKIVGNEDDILQYAEIVAGLFKTSLIF